jgi:hypothetical protein
LPGEREPESSNHRPGFAFRKALDEEFMVAVGSTPEELAALLAAEMEKWWPVIYSAFRSK